MKRHVAATAAATVLATALLAACGPDTDDESALNEPATEEVTPQPQPAPSAAASSDAVAMLAINTGDEVGAYLTDANGQAVYIFSADQQDQSACDQECAQVWKPLTVGQGQMNPAAAPETGAATTPEGAATPQGENAAPAQPTPAEQPNAMAGQLQADLVGTIQRPDGTTQITYAGHPLYTYVQDQTAGDITGQDVNQFGGDWYLVSPSGDKIEAETEQGSS